MWFSYTCIFLFQFLFTYRFLQNTEYSFLCYTVGHYWLSILYIVCVDPQSISCVWLFVTSWTEVHQTPLSMGFSGQEYWNGLPFPTLRDLPDTGIELVSLALAGKLFTSEIPGKPAYSSECLLFPKILIYPLPFSLRRDTKQNIYEQQQKNNHDQFFWFLSAYSYTTLLMKIAESLNANDLSSRCSVLTFLSLSTLFLIF